MPTTLKDLARILELSESTVSRALKNHPRISKATTERVQRLARELNYTPNQLALSLQKKHMNAIGVVVPRISYHFYAQAISGMEAIAEQQDYNIIICQSNESYEREQGIIRELMGSRVAGFIISLSSETKNYDHFARIRSAKVPLVFFNRECKDIVTDKVVIDNYGAAKSAVQHLVKVGCRRLAYLGGPPEVQISNYRMKGFLAAARKAGIPDEAIFVQHTDFNPAAAQNAARQLLYSTDAPDGILAFSDQLALNVMTVAKERGQRIPDDLCIIGFNNEPVDQLVEPSLTSIDQPAFEMGEAAVRLLLDQLRSGGQYRKPERIVLTAELLIRESTNR
ncbi:MAG: LacI family DNA-binding transcriptional regulator [Bacteroidota bacterium]